MSATWRIIEGDALQRLRELPDASVHCCVTSPPYFGLRDYGHDGQLGLEPTPGEFVDALVAVFAECRRVLRDDGTLWLNLGDSYNARQRGSDAGWDKSRLTNSARVQKAQAAALRPRPAFQGSKPKDLLGIPWMVAFALQADGWYLRSDIVWSKTNPMPESVTDRPSRSHEYVFLLSKSARYYYDADAIREDDGGRASGNGFRRPERLSYRDPDGADRGSDEPWKPGGGRNRRSVWTIATQPYREAHFATFPPKLVEPCILAGCPEGGVVLDPFAGAGTTGLVALRRGRSFIGIELNPEYVNLARNRLRDDAPLLNTAAEAAA